MRKWKRVDGITSSLALLLLLSISVGCHSNEVTDDHGSGITFNYPLAASGRATMFVDGNSYPFADDFNYCEYYEGDDLKDEFAYYASHGFHSAFNIDLNADSEYFQILILDKTITPGIYEMKDTAIAGYVSISFELNDTLQKSPERKLVEGLLQITKIDAISKRVSGLFRCTLETVTNKERHVIEGSFTDIFFRNGVTGGEVLTADITGGNGWTCKFGADKFYSAFGNNSGQGIKGTDYFAIVSSTQESSQTEYESFRFFIKKPISSGSFGIEAGCAYHNSYTYDSLKSLFVLKQADTNSASIPNAVHVSDYDPILRRISGTFDFTFTDNSPRSPIRVKNGKFVDLFWW